MGWYIATFSAGTIVGFLVAALLSANADK